MVNNILYANFKKNNIKIKYLKKKIVLYRGKLKYLKLRIEFAF